MTAADGPPARRRSFVAASMRRAATGRQLVVRRPQAGRHVLRRLGQDPRGSERQRVRPGVGSTGGAGQSESGGYRPGRYDLPPADDDRWTTATAYQVVYQPNASPEDYIVAPGALSMPAPRVSVVREHEPLTGLREDDQRDLERFALAQPTDERGRHWPVLSLRHGRLHAQNYVGTIETRRGEP